MMITVNLYADRMMDRSPTSADEVLYATHQQSALYTDAAKDIGLNTAQYAEFRNDLLDGKVLYVQLPHHLDAMAGSHHGRAYALRNVYVPQSTMGWQVALVNGTNIYIPQICGNLSLLRGTARHVAAVPRRHPVQHLVAASHQRPVQPPTQVTFVPPPVAPPVIPVESTTVTPPVAPVVAGPNGRALYALPLLFLGLGGGGNNNSAPPCSAGSNQFGACQR